MQIIDQSHYRNEHSFCNKLARLIWTVAAALLFRPTPRYLHAWRILLLRCFGARIGRGCAVHPSCRIWAPWNLEMGDFSCLSFDVDCYSVARVSLGSNVTISQYSFLCTASHDISDPNMRLTTSPIVIEDGAWVAARAFVAPGVTVGQGAVVGACSVVTRRVEAWSIVAGNPAKPIGARKLAQ